MQTAYSIRAMARGFVLFVAPTLLLVSLTSCVSAPPPKPDLIAQARHENAIGSDLARQFEAKLHYRSDASVNHYLDGIAAAIGAPSGDPRLTLVQVAIISNPGRRWRSFSLPGRKVYFPLGLLRELRFDNEVAAVIALEDGHIIEKHAIDNLNRQLAAKTPKTKKAKETVETSADAVPIPPSVDFLGPSGIFSFDMDQVKASVTDAVKLMYGAGYDVRGLIQIWHRFEENPAHSPYSPAELEQLMDFTRETISLYAPMRNPIVGTSGFKAIRKRIEEL